MIQIAESIDLHPTPLTYQQIAAEMTRRGYPMTQQLARMIERKALRKLAKKFPDLLHDAGLEPG